jgi:hypothetical protein
MRIADEEVIRNMRRFACLLLCTILLLQHCAFALEGAAEGIAMEEVAAAGAAEAGAAEAGALSRIMIGGEALEAAAEEGVLSRSLYELTRAGPITLDISEAGTITYEGSELGALTADGEIVARTPGGARLVGRLSDGRLWDVDSTGGLASPVGRLRGFVPSRGIRLLDAPGGGTRVAILRNNLAAEVLQIHEGWYEVRLPSGETGWLPAALVLLSVGKSSDERTCPPGEGTLVLASGRVIPFRQCSEENTTLRLVLMDDTTVIVDALLVDHMDTALPSLPLVTLTSGMSFPATTASASSGATVFHLQSREDIVVDTILLDNPPAVGPAG